MRIHIKDWLPAALCALALLTAPAAALTQEPSPEPSGEPERYNVTLESRTIGAGENCFYQTVGASFLGNPYAADYYPGELTVELSGPITVAAGGQLSIGKMAVDGPEASPVLRGELSPEGLIRVEAGGVLWLNGVTPDLSGEGLFIVQEPGAVVEVHGMTLDEELCQWSGPVVDDRYASAVEVPLMVGDRLTPEHLPAQRKIWLNDRGRSEFVWLPVTWDTAPCAGQTEGEAVISGTYLDETGQPVPSFLPVEAHLRWYTPEEIVLTERSFVGSTTPAARLGCLTPPEEATERWGEVSSDGGKSWTRWEDCFWTEDDGYWFCTFAVADALPRQYRIAASDWVGERFWRSEAVTLPEGDTEDQGGNRGGSITPVPPTREPDEEPRPSPKPAAKPNPEPTPVPVPEPVSEPSPEPSSEPSIEPAPGPALNPAPEPSVSVEPPRVSEPPPPEERSVSPAPTAEPKNPPTDRTALPLALQIALGAAGLAVCGIVGTAVAGVGPFRKKK